MRDYTETCMKEAEEMLVKHKRKNVEYCDKLTALADSILETRIRVDEIMVNQLMDYYSLDSSLEPEEVFETTLKAYYDGGTAGLCDTLVKASDWLRLECHKVRTEEVRFPFM
jgi:hypothetical protein